MQYGRRQQTSSIAAFFRPSTAASETIETAEETEDIVHGAVRSSENEEVLQDSDADDEAENEAEKEEVEAEADQVRMFLRCVESSFSFVHCR